MRIIALIDDVGVIERTLKHLSVWDPQPEARSAAGPDPPWPKGEGFVGVRVHFREDRPLIPVTRLPNLQ